MTDGAGPLYSRAAAGRRAVCKALATVRLQPVRCLEWWEALTPETT